MSAINRDTGERRQTAQKKIKCADILADIVVTNTTQKDFTLDNVDKQSNMHENLEAPHAFF